ncbi:MAG: hypothetical protein R3B98_03940 [Hyphomonas sp.]
MGKIAGMIAGALLIAALGFGGGYLVASGGPGGAAPPVEAEEAPAEAAAETPDFVQVPDDVPEVSDAPYQAPVGLGPAQEPETVPLDVLTELEEDSTGAPVVAIGEEAAEDAPDAGEEAVDPSTFPVLNDFVLETVSMLAAEKAGLGYERNSSFTENIPYPDGELVATGGTNTMCVAAAMEVLARSVNTWSDRNSNTVAYETLPLRLWRSGAEEALRPWVYVHKLDRTIPTYGRDYGSGTHDAVILLGLGLGVKFEEARPGDFVNFNRTGGSGHAAIFLGYVDSDGNPLESYGPDVAGFHYFSAQSSGVSGLDYRNAFFSGHCPPNSAGKPRRDCSVIRSNNVGMFSMARIFTPDHWHTEDTKFFLDRLFLDKWDFDQIAAERYTNPMGKAAKRSLALNRSMNWAASYERELDTSPAVDFSGVTTD